MGQLIVGLLINIGHSADSDPVDSEPANSAVGQLINSDAIDSKPAKNIGPADSEPTDN